MCLIAFGCSLPVWKGFHRNRQLVTPSMLKLNSMMPYYNDEAAITLYTGNRSGNAVVHIIPIANTNIDTFTANKSKTPHDYVLEYIMHKFEYAQNDYQT